MERLIKQLKEGAAPYIAIGILMGILIVGYLHPSTAHSNDYSQTATAPWSISWNTATEDNPFTTRTTEGNSADLGTSTSATPQHVTYAGGDHYSQGDLEVHKTFYPTYGYVMTSFDVAVTSPTNTFSALNADGTKRFAITLIPSATGITGAHPTGGVLGQVIHMTVGGSGSNTCRFDDDGTSMMIGANFTFTSGQYDVMAIRCVVPPASSSGYGRWQKLYSADN